MPVPPTSPSRSSMSTTSPGSPWPPCSTDPANIGQLYEVTGPRLLTFTEALLRAPQPPEPVLWAYVEVPAGRHGRGADRRLRSARTRRGHRAGRAVHDDPRWSQRGRSLRRRPAGTRRRPITHLSSPPPCGRGGDWKLINVFFFVPHADHDHRRRGQRSSCWRVLRLLYVRDERPALRAFLAPAGIAAMQSINLAEAPTPAFMLALFGSATSARWRDSAPPGC